MNYKTPVTNFVKITLSVGLVFLSIWSLLPLFLFGVLSIGTVFAVLLSIFFLFLLWGKSIKIKLLQSKLGSLFLRTFVIIYAIGMFITFIIGSVIINASFNKNISDGDTVIVLGCQVRGTAPSLLLQLRINAAYEFLIENPSSVCIVSGGQGPGEDITEAEAMYTDLTEKGIDKSRIIMEVSSTSTKENIQNSYNIIKDEGLSENISIATDGYHQFRAQREAKKLGLKPAAINAQTPWYMLGCYFMREIIAVAKTFVFG